MTNTMTIKLKPSMMSRLEQKTKELKINTDALINKALEDYFYFERLKNIREELRGEAKKNGFENEEDIFNAIS